MKDGWYKDPANSTYYECTNQPAYTGYTYNCSAGSYAPKPGYFLFGNGSVYKAITWTDAATGATALGNWSGTGNWGGWDQKAILVPSGATMALSCLPTWKVEALGFDNGSPKISNDWILIDTDLEWFAPEDRYADPANPPAGWTWTGTEWAEAAPPAPTP